MGGATVGAGPLSAPRVGSEGREPVGRPAAGLSATTTEYDWWGNPAKVVETANGVTRTTTTTHDGAGRPERTAV
ncbi:hypothetical protein ACWHA1_20515, partial [Streptomyces decoyicus]